MTQALHDFYVCSLSFVYFTQLPLPSSSGPTFLEINIYHFSLLISLTFYFLNIGDETGVWSSTVFSVIIQVYLLADYLLHHLRLVQALCHQFQSNPASSNSRLSSKSGENQSPFMSVEQGSHVEIFIIFAKRIVECLSNSQPTKYKEEFADKIHILQIFSI